MWCTHKVGVEVELHRARRIRLPEAAAQLPIWQAFKSD